MDDDSVLTRAARPPDRIERYGPHPDHVVDVYLPRASAGGRTVTVVHGGFWRPGYDRRHARPLAEALSEIGRTVRLLEYRRIPGHPDVTVGDVRQALGTAAPGTLIGHSAGGHLSLLAASGASVTGLTGVLALAPVADLRLGEQLGLGSGAVVSFLGATADTRADLDPVRTAVPVLPVTVVQGASDEVVPPALSHRYAAAAPATRLVVVPGAGHFAVIDPASSAWQVVVDELERLEGGPHQPLSTR